MTPQPQQQPQPRQSPARTEKAEIIAKFLREHDTDLYRRWWESMETKLRSGAEDRLDDLFTAACQLLKEFGLGGVRPSSGAGAVGGPQTASSQAGESMLFAGQAQGGAANRSPAGRSRLPGNLPGPQAPARQGLQGPGSAVQRQGLQQPRDRVVSPAQNGLSGPPQAELPKRPADLPAVSSPSTQGRTTICGFRSTQPASVAPSAVPKSKPQQVPATPASTWPKTRSYSMDQTPNPYLGNIPDPGEEAPAQDTRNGATSPVDVGSSTPQFARSLVTPPAVVASRPPQQKICTSRELEIKCEKLGLYVLARWAGHHGGMGLARGLSPMGEGILDICDIVEGLRSKNGQVEDAMKNVRRASEWLYKGVYGEWRAAAGCAFPKQEIDQAAGELRDSFNGIASLRDRFIVVLCGAAYEIDRHDLEEATTTPPARVLPLSFAKLPREAGEQRWKAVVKPFDPALIAAEAGT